MSLRIASIWAQDRNGVLGDGHGMLWHVPADFKHFKTETIDCPVVMGRSSFQALGKPLPRRLNIVLSRDPSYRPEGGVPARSLEEALAAARRECERTGAKTIWITGGAQVYQQAMPVADELVVTELDLEVPELPGRRLVHAPRIDPAEWEVDPIRSDLPASGPRSAGSGKLSSAPGAETDRSPASAQGTEHLDEGWRPRSGDARWRVRTYRRLAAATGGRAD